jgi:hypothetical protein
MCRDINFKSKYEKILDCIVISVCITFTALIFSGVIFILNELYISFSKTPEERKISDAIDHERFIEVLKIREGK